MRMCVRMCMLFWKRDLTIYQAYPVLITEFESTKILFNIDSGYPQDICFSFVSCPDIPLVLL